MANKGKEIRRLELGRWEVFIAHDSRVSESEVAGKYLFFSEDREKLVRIALAELERGIFPRAKIPARDQNPHPEYVLCLYYSDDNFKQDLAAKYSDCDGVKYRYWKSNEATARAEYSEEFLEQLPPDVREQFES